MLIQVVIPKSEELTIKIPAHLIGKELEIDIKERRDPAFDTPPVKKLRGRVPKKLAIEMLQHIEKSRNEWNQQAI